MEMCHYGVQRRLSEYAAFHFVELSSTQPKKIKRRPVFQIGRRCNLKDEYSVLDALALFVYLPCRGGPWNTVGRNVLESSIYSGMVSNDVSASGWRNLLSPAWWLSLSIACSKIRR